MCRLARELLAAEPYQQMSPATSTTGSFDRALGERPCPNATCGCHIGYGHLDELDLHRTYGSGVLERIHAEPVWRRHLHVVA